MSFTTRLENFTPAEAEEFLIEVATEVKLISKPDILLEGLSRMPLALPSTALIWEMTQTIRGAGMTLDNQQLMDLTQQLRLIRNYFNWLEKAYIARAGYQLDLELLNIEPRGEMDHGWWRAKMLEGFRETKSTFNELIVDTGK